MGPTWILSASDGPHVGLRNLAIRVSIITDISDTCLVINALTACIHYQQTLNLCGQKLADMQSVRRFYLPVWQDIDTIKQLFIHLIVMMRDICTRHFGIISTEVMRRARSITLVSWDAKSSCALPGKESSIKTWYENQDVIWLIIIGNSEEEQLTACNVFNDDKAINITTLPFHFCLILVCLLVAVSCGPFY